MSQQPEVEWTRLVRAVECAPDAGRFVRSGEYELAVFRLGTENRFVVTRNSCPHAGANLSASEIDGSVITCPWHHWEFDLDTGHCVHTDRVQIQRFECKVEGGWVWAKLTGGPLRELFE